MSCPTLCEDPHYPALSAKSLSKKYIEILKNTVVGGATASIEVLITSHSPEVTQKFLNKWIGIKSCLLTSTPMVASIQYEGKSELQIRISSLIGYENVLPMREMHFASKKAFLVVISSNEVESISTLNEVQEICGKIYGQESQEAKNIIAILGEDNHGECQSIRMHCKERGIHVAGEINELCNILVDVYKQKNVQTDANVNDNMEILVLGDSTVGKTTLVSRIMNEELSYYMQTRNFSTRSKITQVGKMFNLKIIDSPGNIKELAGFDSERGNTPIITATVEKTLSLLKTKNLLDISVVYIVFDISNIDSYNYALELLKKFSAVSSKTKIVVFGNKQDVAIEFGVEFSTSEIEQKADMFYITSFTTISDAELQKIVSKTIKFARPTECLPKVLPFPGHIETKGIVQFGEKKTHKLFLKIKNGVLHYADSEKELDKKGKCLSLKGISIDEVPVEQPKKGKEIKEAILDITFGDDKYQLKTKTVDERTEWKNALLNSKIMCDILDGSKRQILEELVVVTASSMTSQMQRQAEEVTHMKDKTYDFNKNPNTTGMVYTPHTDEPMDSKGKKDKKDKKKK
ncbi:Miro family protein [Entamoeba histolytica HM-1:IMSS-B]|uniref:PH domain containing protein n=6 Tax=Entamoeba histolytica TaxID=5759 RepID=B1N4D4_ENTH1|nr:PH domain containing protein [Entamoeba histolytica HM-1:IMSS]EMD44605.1 PH domain containing protein [Entamoeba histolytica KU27]EMH72895.1 Miro family protein [Entamoeba histolytica HM-1:IMSS-B]EMS16911.1 Miro family protein [Entamoeba histolytica HM-3:IMSS]ENY63323.1 Miro family protein, putative [Entamoeba histolytica HM-1:IMSS-A]GAT98136.1 ph domain containing protein [Entamoeba histolytica]|eukprot:XP_001914050.1 PH domain containing protein [Entamoeba histolytica HM-1:IMSS]